MYLQIVGDKPLKKVTTPYLDSELNANDWEIIGNLGERFGFILMKISWLARLSRQDLAHAVTKLASGITRWSVKQGFSFAFNAHMEPCFRFRGHHEDSNVFLRALPSQNLLPSMMDCMGMLYQVKRF